MRKALVAFRAGATERDAQNFMAKRAQDGGAAPLLSMPAWKNLLSAEDSHQIVEFLWSKRQKDSW